MNAISIFITELKMLTSKIQAKHSVMSGLHGTFTWAEWGTEVGVAAAMSAFTVAPTYFAGYATATCGFRDG